MKHKNALASCRKGFWGVTFILAFFLTATSWAEEVKEVKKVAILPFVINSAERMDFLREGVQDMLASRLTWEDHVLVLDSFQVQKAREKTTGPLDEARAVEIGKQLGADVALWGSINVLGTTVSLDINLVNIALRQPMKKFYAQAKNMDEVIIRVNELTDMINEKVFDRSRKPPTVSEAAPQPKSPEPSSETAPSGKVPLSLKEFTIKPPSSQMIIRTGGSTTPGVWRSSTLPFALIDMSFGDLDGDGKTETVLISKNRVYIYRYLQDKFELVKEIRGGLWDNYLSVDVADIHGTGTPQIFITNYRDNTLRSLTLAWSKEGYKTIADNIPYYLRVHQLPGRGTVLLGQQKFGEKFFDNKIVILSWKEGGYVAVDRLNVPDGLTIFDFVLMKDNKDGSQEILHINRNNRLMVLSEKGKPKYSSSDVYGGTLNLLRRSEDESSLIIEKNKDQDLVYIPARLVVTSISNPGEKEIILNKNKGSFFNFLARYRAFNSGEIYSFSWDGGGMKENWRTPIINDYIANYNVGDFKNNGQKQLVVGIVQSTGITLISDARSVLQSYDLGEVKKTNSK